MQAANENPECVGKYLIKCLGNPKGDAGNVILNTYSKTPFDAFSAYNATIGVTLLS